MGVIPWCSRDAVHVGRLLQAGWFCNHWLQSGVWLGHVQSLLHRPPRKKVSTLTLLVTCCPYCPCKYAFRYIYATACMHFLLCLFPDVCLLWPGAVWVWEGSSWWSRPTLGTTPPTGTGRSTSAQHSLPPLENVTFRTNKQATGHSNPNANHALIINPSV